MRVLTALRLKDAKSWHSRRKPTPPLRQPDVFTVANFKCFGERLSVDEGAVVALDSVLDKQFPVSADQRDFLATKREALRVLHHLPHEVIAGV